MRKLISFASTAIFVGATPVWAMTEAEGLAQVKTFTLEHNADLGAQAQVRRVAAAAYSAIIAVHGVDSSAAWTAEGPAMSDAVSTLRSRWLETSNQYETIEGIVAGIPSLVKYDLIL